MRRQRESGRERTKASNGERETNEEKKKKINKTECSSASRFLRVGPVTLCVYLFPVFIFVTVFQIDNKNLLRERMK